jgi:hypothetical protein
MKGRSNILSSPSFRLVAVFFVVTNLEFGIASTSPVSAQRTAWTRVHIADSVNLYSVVFADSLTGYAIGEGTVHPLYTVLFRTLDGGQHWSQLPLLVNGSKPPFVSGFSSVILAPSDAIVYLANVGNYGLLRSTNKGDSWDSVSGMQYAPNWVMWTSSKGGRLNCATGACATEVTEDSGRTFSSKGHTNDTFYYSYFPPYTSMGPCWPDSLRWVFPTKVDSGVGLFLTSDAGAHWSVDTLTGQFQVSLREACTIPSSKNIWILYTQQSGHPHSSEVGFSSNWGATWTVVDTLLPPVILKMLPVGERDIWLAASNSDSLIHINPINQIWHSTDNGRSWMVDSISLLGANIRDFTFSDPQHGWAIYDTVKVPGLWDQVVSAYVYIYNASTAEVKSVTKPTASLDIFPNPASGTVTISGFDQPTTATVELIDQLGRVVKRTVTTNGNPITLSTSDLPDGYYLVLARTQTKTYSRGFLKISQ